MIRSITFHQIYDFANGHRWFCFCHVMNMVFVSFHIPDDYMMLLAYLKRKSFYIIRYLLWCQQFLSIIRIQKLYDTAADIYVCF